MNESPIWEQIGTSFVDHYYKIFDSNRGSLAPLYIESSCLSWEAQRYQGKDAIVEKLISLPFGTIRHLVTAQDHQPTPDNCILSMVVGQLKVDEDPVMGFHQVLSRQIETARKVKDYIFKLQHEIQQDV